MALRRRRPRAGHIDQLVDGYRPRLTPGNLDRILAKGQSSTDLIHTESTQVFRGFGRGFRARGHHPGRNAPQHVRPGDGTRSSTKRSSSSCLRKGDSRPAPRPERPTERASSKARVPGRPPREGRIQAPGRPFDGTATRGRRKPVPVHPLHGCRRPARTTGQGAPRGSIKTTTQARHLTKRKLCRGDHLWCTPSPPTHRSTAQGGGTGRAATNDRPNDQLVAVWEETLAGGRVGKNREALSAPTTPPMPPLTYPPTSFRDGFRRKMFATNFVIPTGNFLCGKRA